MARSRALTSWLPRARSSKLLGETPTGDAFRNEWIDFQRGIRVGNIEPHERITQILKYHLEREFGTPFITDRYGRGVFWQWICWLPRANREAKPISNRVNFGCAKFYITTDEEPPTFHCGLTIERGYVRAPGKGSSFILQRDWDWHRLTKQLRSGSQLDGELLRLLRKEEFVAEIGNYDARVRFDKTTFRSARQLAEAMGRAKDREWAGFLLYYPISERELRSCSGQELTAAIMAAFRATVPVMNLCMEVPLQEKV